ncbi:MAG: polyprenol monophosphomannose synthase [Candidatus Omnitrophica bacterium]|nr:polyprenol monophosphomannose synthase [Candidatus Omnitrophota bacterium]
MNKKSVAIVIPTYNEKENIPFLIEEILKIPLNIKVLIIDDNSPDKTADIVRDKFINNPRVSVYVRRDKKGRGLAEIFGFREALKTDAEIIGEMDADFSHHPRFIPRMIEKIYNCDVVIGSRYIKEGRDIERGILRKIISRLSHIYIRTILGIKLSDPTSGFRFFRREVIEKIIDKLSAEDPFIITEIIFYLKKYRFRISEVPIVFHQRMAGTSKLTPKILFKYLFNILLLRTGLWKKRNISGTHLFL